MDLTVLYGMCSHLKPSMFRKVRDIPVSERTFTERYPKERITPCSATPQPTPLAMISETQKQAQLPCLQANAWHWKCHRHWLTAPEALSTQLFHQSETVNDLLLPSEAYLRWLSARPSPQIRETVLAEQAPAAKLRQYVQEQGWSLISDKEVSDGVQIRISDSSTVLSVTCYHTGTILIQGHDGSLKKRLQEWSHAVKYSNNHPGSMS